MGQYSKEKDDCLDFNIFLTLGECLIKIKVK